MINNEKRIPCTFMLFILHAEADKLCLKDLSSDVTRELHQRLQADKAAMQKVIQFFGLRPFLSTGLTDLKDLFPDTTVSVLKKCFEALRMNDLAEIMEKVRPRSLRPALSPAHIEILWRAGERPTKYHSDVAVLVVNHAVEKNIVKSKNPEKIETFFKDLNSKNEVAKILLTSSQETRKFLREINEATNLRLNSQPGEDLVKKHYEMVLLQKARLEKELGEMKKGNKQRQSRVGPELRHFVLLELHYEDLLEHIAKERDQTKRDIEKLKELEKESTKPISTAMDKWIHNQGWLTFK